MQHYQLILLSVLRIVGVVFCTISTLILALALFDLLAGMRWGATWLSVLGGIVFIAIGFSIIWVTNQFLNHLGD
jgi:hypothetical protein